MVLPSKFFSAKTTNYNYSIKYSILLMAHDITNQVSRIEACLLHIHNYHSSHSTACIALITTISGLSY